MPYEDLNWNTLGKEIQNIWTNPLQDANFFKYICFSVAIAYNMKNILKIHIPEWVCPNILNLENTSYAAMLNIAE
jgi:hypothetical protein